jgi:hypothetical protein
LKKTIEWYRENGPWIEKVRDPAYREYYKTQYGFSHEEAQKAQSSAETD